MAFKIPKFIKSISNKFSFAGKDAENITSEESSALERFLGSSNRKPVNDEAEDSSNFFESIYDEQSLPDNDIIIGLTEDDMYITKGEQLKPRARRFLKEREAERVSGKNHRTKQGSKKEEKSPDSDKQKQDTSNKEQHDDTSSNQGEKEKPEPDAPSSGSTETSMEKSDNKKTDTTKFVSSDDPRIGTVDSDGNFYMPDDISGGGISASAKQHAYQKAYDKAAGSQKWQDEQIEKIKSAEKPQNMSDEEWQKAQQKQIDAINKQADKMRNDWLTMQKDSTKINPGLSDYVLGNPHTTAGVLGGGTLGYLALQLSDSRGQMTNQQLYGQDDLT